MEAKAHNKKKKKKKKSKVNLCSYRIWSLEALCYSQIGYF